MAEINERSSLLVFFKVTNKHGDDQTLYVMYTVAG